MADRPRIFDDMKLFFAVLVAILLVLLRFSFYELRAVQDLLFASAQGAPHDFHAKDICPILPGHPRGSRGCGLIVAVGAVVFFGDRLHDHTCSVPRPEGLVVKSIIDAPKPFY